MTESHQLLEFRISNLEGAVGEIKTAVKSIDASFQTMTTLMTRMEAHHAETREALGRAFGEIQDHENRLRTIEDDLPTLRLIRNWVIAAVIGVISVVGIATLALTVNARAAAYAAASATHQAGAAPGGSHARVPGAIYSEGD